VLEESGKYDIPGIRFQWWDPDSRELKQQIIPGLSLDVQLSPTDKAAANAVHSPSRSINNYLGLLLAALTTVTAWYLWSRFGSGLKRQTPGHDTETEKSAFAHLQKACSENQAVQAYSAVHYLLEWSSPALSANLRSQTLSEFAMACDDTQLATQLQQLQEALISSNSNWQGKDLLNSLQSMRRRINRQKARHSNAHLAPLNPGSH